MAKLGARAGRFTKLVKLLGKLRRCEELGGGGGVSVYVFLVG